MVNPIWYVIHEYETYDDKEPHHTWLVSDKCESKAKAELSALAMSFDEYCANKPHRWRLTDQRKVPENLTQDDKIRIVRHVISNIGERTASENQYWGIGFYIIDNLKLKVNKNVVKITNIHNNIIDKAEIKPKVSKAIKPDEKKGKSKIKHAESESESESDSEDEFESGSDRTYELSESDGSDNEEHDTNSEEETTPEPKKTEAEPEPEGLVEDPVEDLVEDLVEDPVETDTETLAYESE